MTIAGDGTLAEWSKACAWKVHVQQCTTGSNPVGSAFGCMVEWFMAAVSKTAVRKRTGGSNPSTTAETRTRGS